MLNRPDSRNAVNEAMAEQLYIAFKAQNRKEVSAVVLCSSSDHFCSGYDLKDYMFDL